MCDVFFWMLSSVQCARGTVPFHFLRWVFLVVCFRFRLDEDCNPGWGDCGRPIGPSFLRGFLFVNEECEMANVFCSLATGLLGQTAHGAKKMSILLSLCAV